MVGRDHKISVYLVGIFKCKFMYKRNAYQLKLINLSSCFRKEENRFLRF